MAVCFQCHLLTASAGDYDNFELFLSQSVFPSAAIIPSGRGLFRGGKKVRLPALILTFSPGRRNSNDVFRLNESHHREPRHKSGHQDGNDVSLSLGRGPG